MRTFIDRIFALFGYSRAADPLQLPKDRKWRHDVYTDLLHDGIASFKVEEHCCYYEVYFDTGRKCAISSVPVKRYYFAPDARPLARTYAHKLCEHLNDCYSLFVGLKMKL